MRRSDAFANAQAYALVYARMCKAMSERSEAQNDDSQNGTEPDHTLSASQAAEMQRIAACVDENWPHAIATALVHGILVERSNAHQHLLTQTPDHARILGCVAEQIAERDQHAHSPE